ncbi:hypothetical protein GQ457_08G016850 [Hibiscus cannabinus]
MMTSSITLNSSKLKTPWPLMSNCLIITLHSSMDLDSPSFFNIFFNSLVVMNPQKLLSNSPGKKQHKNGKEISEKQNGTSGEEKYMLSNKYMIYI